MFFDGALTLEMMNILMDHALCVCVEQIDLVLVDSFGHASGTFKFWAYRSFIGMFCANCSQNCRLDLVNFAIERIVLRDALKGSWRLCSSFFIRHGYGIFFLN